MVCSRFCDVLLFPEICAQSQRAHICSELHSDPHNGSFTGGSEGLDKLETSLPMQWFRGKLDSLEMEQKMLMQKFEMVDADDPTLKYLESNLNAPKCF